MRRGTLRAAAGWTAAATFFALLAVWSSPLSVPMLLAVAGVESLRSARVDGTAWRPRLLPLVPPLAATLLERGLHDLHRRWARAHHLWFVRTAFGIDLAHLCDGVAHMVAAMVADPVHATVLGLAFVAMVYAGAQLVRRPHVPADRDVLDAATMALGCLAIGAVQLVAAVTTTWVRMSLYEPRYVCLTPLFWWIGGAAGVAALAGERGRRALRLVAPAAALAACLAARTPVAVGGEDLAARAATDLAAAAPATIVVGGYWGTYVLAGAAPTAGLVPVPLEGQYDRIPWLARSLPTADRIVASHLFAPDTLGGADDPARLLFEHGTVFELEEAGFLRREPFVFSRYRRRPYRRPLRVRVRGHGGRRAMDGRRKTAMAVGAHDVVDVALAPATTPRRLVVFCRHAPEVRARARVRVAGRQLAGDVEPTRGAFVVSLPSDTTRVQLRLARRTTSTTHVEEIVVLDGAPSEPATATP